MNEKNEDKFVTAVNCMDGRAQLPVINYLKEYFHAGYIDMITEPGPNKILADKSDTILIDSIKKRIEISIDKHGSNLVALVGHCDCAGNPSPKENQIRHIKSGVVMIKKWFQNIHVIGLWVDENWNAQRVC
ncbi:MAG: hypothetical protein JW827_06415 [Spirochaetes bacterium]|nr:hypothetical protein [Spirochaetota bacterium]